MHCTNFTHFSPIKTTHIGDLAIHKFVQLATYTLHPRQKIFSNVGEWISMMRSRMSMHYECLKAWTNSPTISQCAFLFPTHIAFNLVGEKFPCHVPYPISQEGWWQTTLVIPLSSFNPIMSLFQVIIVIDYKRI